MATRSSKRIKIANTRACYISGLPDSALVHVARYLAAPSRILFALAISRGKLHQCKKPSTTAKAIISSGVSDNTWENLDFSEIDKSLASRLTDDDIKSILVYINARHKLKKLNLNGCINITGVGLEPLRNSTIVLEVIDLSLVGQHECPNIHPVPPISELIVISILDSVITADGSSLRYLLLPKKFRSNPNKTLDTFLRKYNRLLKSRDTKCSARDGSNVCNQSIVTAGRVATGWTMTSKKEGNIELYGTQSFTCSKCTNNICDNCNDPRDDNHSYIEHCDNCERDYCLDCSEMLMCVCCNDYECANCVDMSECKKCTQQTCKKCMYKCTSCSKDICLDCVSTKKGCNINATDTAKKKKKKKILCNTKDCNIALCSDCFLKGKKHALEDCEDCKSDDAFCLGCRFSRCTLDWRNACRGCLEIVGPHIELRKKTG